MTTILAIDPGAHSGLALLEGSSVVFACYPPTPAPLRMYHSHEWKIDTLVIEMPQYYPRMKVDPQSLIPLAVNVGKWIALNPAGALVTPYPRQWKGQVQKEVTYHRVEKALTAREKSDINWEVIKTDHNIVDAVALGLWYVGRYR